MMSDKIEKMDTNGKDHNEADNFVEDFIQQLDDQSRPDYQTQYRLSQAREQALNSVSAGKGTLTDVLVMISRPRRIILAAIPLIAVAWIAITAIVPTQQNNALEDIDILSAEADTEMLQDLEFYQWLATEDEVR